MSRLETLLTYGARRQAGPRKYKTASFLLYNIAGLVSKLSDADWMAYVESFDFVTLTDTFIDENFDFSHVFTDYVKFVSPAIKLSHQTWTRV